MATASRSPTRRLLLQTVWIVPLCAITAAALVMTAYLVDPFALPLALAAVALVVLAFRHPAWGVAAAVAMIPLELFSFKLPSGSVSPTEAAFVVVGIAWLCRALGRPQTVVRPSVRDSPILVLLGVTIAGVGIAVHTTPVLRVFVLWLFFYFVYLQVQSFSAQEMRRVLIAFSLGAGVLGAVGAVDYLRSGHAVLYNAGLLTGARAKGTFGDPNYFASVLALAIPPATALALREIRRDGWLLAAAIAAGAGVVFSLSRGGALALALGLVTLMLWSHARKVVLVLVLMLGTILTLNPDPITQSHSYATVTERLGTINPRLLTETNRRPLIWSTAVTVAEEHPFLGTGVDQFSSAAAAHGLTEGGTPIENVHNLPLNFAAETGVIGLAAFIALIAQWVVRGIQALKLRDRDRLSYSIALGLFAALLGFIVQAMTLSQLRVNVIAGIFFLFGGMITALADRARVGARQTASVPVELKPTHPTLYEPAGATQLPR
jgi:O-antigen ligase